MALIVGYLAGTSAPARFTVPWSRPNSDPLLEDGPLATGATADWTFSRTDDKDIGEERTSLDVAPSG